MRLYGTQSGETGRKFIYDDLNMVLVREVPDHDEWHLWTEYRDEDNNLEYMSDHEGYCLDEEEFGPIEEDEQGPIVFDWEGYSKS